MRLLSVAVLAVLVLAVPGWAQTTSTSSSSSTSTSSTSTSTLIAKARQLAVDEVCAAGCTTGNGTVYVAGSGAHTLVFELTSTGTLDAKLQDSITGGASWVDTASMTCTGCGATVRWRVSNPVGLYRLVRSTCTSCTYSLGHERAGYQVAP